MLAAPESDACRLGHGVEVATEHDVLVGALDDLLDKALGLCEADLPAPRRFRGRGRGYSARRGRLLGGMFRCQRTRSCC